eukprot:TRINITY_DN41243_c0_g1_i1.p1 TRINITY_DN41243_c0_g1~~TRINITY_DN41243_c0_g1_i1.p1  ORF type:complete len:193 (-),score=73.73 TRINITY_DN41243_c0_g1_i1:222-800(-)
MVDGKAEKSDNACSLFARQLEKMLLIDPPSESLREELFKFAIELKEEGVGQEAAAVLLARAHTAWKGPQKMMGDQSQRLSALEDALKIVTGFEDAPSPLYGATLVGKPTVVRDSAFLDMQGRAAGAVGRTADSKIMKLMERQAAIQQQLEQLQREVDEDDDAADYEAEVIYAGKGSKLDVDEAALAEDEGDS